VSRALCKPYSWLFVFLLFSLSAAFNAMSLVAQTVSADTPIVSPLIAPNYFPPGSLSERTATWLTKNLQSIAEPPLLGTSSKSEVASFRLIKHGLTSKTTVLVIRIQIESDGTAILFTKSVSQDGAIVLNNHDRISADQVRAFLEMVKQSGFWSLPTTEEEQRQVKDGGTWYLEGHHENIYHIVYRHNPVSAPLADVEAFLVNLAKLDK